MEDNKDQVDGSMGNPMTRSTSVLDSFNPIAKTETEKLLEEALKTLTKSEKEYGLMHHITFRTPKEVEELKESYRKYKTFTFGRKLKAIWNLLFGKVTPHLFMFVIDQEIERSFEKALDPTFNPLAAKPIAGMENIMENVKMRENDSTRMANDLDKSIEKLVTPKIVETIRMSSTKKRTRTTKKAAEPTKKAVPATKRSPKKTK